MVFQRQYKYCTVEAQYVSNFIRPQCKSDKLEVFVINNFILNIARIIVQLMHSTEACFGNNLNWRNEADFIKILYALGGIILETMPTNIAQFVSSFIRLQFKREIKGRFHHEVVEWRVYKQPD